MTWHLFVSYRRLDKEPVQRLVKLLSETHGLDVWIDQSAIETFASSTEAIREGLSRSRALLAWYSRSYPASRACQWELTGAYLAAQRSGPPRERVLVVNPEMDNAHIHPVDLRDENFQQISLISDEALKGVAVAVAGHLEKISPTTLGALRPLSGPQWYGRAPAGSNRFVGRLADLWRIQSGLFGREHAIVARQAPAVVQLRGIGGAGKTLLAEEYALRFGLAFPKGIYWLRAPGPNAVEQDPSREQVEALRQQQLASIAVEIGIPAERLGDGRSAGSLIREVLEARASGLGDPDAAFLWVVDDLPTGLSRDELDSWTAPHRAGRTLITTRSREHDAYGTVLDLGQLHPEEAMSLLRIHRDPGDGEELEAARAIAEDLGHHPLALELAGAALARGEGLFSFAEYRRKLANPEKDALELAAKLVGELPTGHEPSIASTLLGSIQNLGEEGLDFLRMAARLAAAPIPASLVARAFSINDALDDESAQQRTVLAFHQCQERSLAEPAAGTRGAWMVHALVGRVVRFRDPQPERQKALRDAAAQALAEVLPGVADIRLHRELELQVRQARHLASGKLAPDVAAALLGWLARFDLERGEYPAALELSLRYRGLSEAAFGPEDERTLLAKGDLARAYRACGNLAVARELEEQVLEGRSRLLGPEHPDTLTAMNNLSATLADLKDHGSARKLNERVLEVRRRLLGPEHEHTLFSMNNLAMSLWETGELNEARRLLEQTVALRQRVLGPDHPSTLASTRNLATLLQQGGDITEAVKLAERVVKMSNDALGPEHPKTLLSLASLCRILISRGENGKARDILAESRGVAMKKLGADHWMTALITNNLAVAMKNLDELAEARPLQEEALAAGRRSLGQRAALTTRFAVNLFELLQKLRDDAGAAEVYRESLAWLVDAPAETLTTEHREVLEKLRSLGAVRIPRPW